MKRPLLLLLAFTFSLLSVAQGDSKLSCYLRQLALTAESPQRMKVRGQGLSPRRVMVLAKLHGDCHDLLSSADAAVMATIGDITILRLPVTSLRRLAASDRVERLEASRCDEVSTATMAEHLNINNVYSGRALPQAYTGRGVVVGMQDVGFDLSHPTFFSSDRSRYRICRFWDMLATDDSGRLLTSDDATTVPVGRDFLSSADILAYGHGRDNSVIYHATHTTGIAAGSGYDTPYQGMAPEADICAVSNYVSNVSTLVDDSERELFTSATNVLGFKYIFDYAATTGQPCVINFSEGHGADFSEEELLYREAIDALVGEGRIIVASAGNANTSPTYIHKERGRSSAGTFLETWGNTLYFTLHGDEGYHADIVFYGHYTDTVTVDSRELMMFPDSVFKDSLYLGEHQYVLSLCAYPSAFDAAKVVVECMIEGPDRIGYSYMRPISVELCGTDQEVEMFKGTGTLCTKSNNPLLCDGERSHNVHSPALLPRVIAVGASAYAQGCTNIDGVYTAHDYGHDGKIASFSSVGPTLDGRTKPDVVAPGTNIISSASSYYFEASPSTSDQNNVVALSTVDGRDYPWLCDTGTSQASPAVAGVIALWLEACPSLTPEQLLEVFANSCTHPDPSLDYPNNTYGYGQIDAYRGLLYLLGIDNIAELKGRDADTMVSIVAITDGFLDIPFPAPLASPRTVTVYSTSGQLVTTVTVGAGSQSCHLSLPLTTAIIVMK